MVYCPGNFDQTTVALSHGTGVVEEDLDSPSTKLGGLSMVLLMTGQ